jgi:hypothetical protein
MLKLKFKTSHDRLTKLLIVLLISGLLIITYLNVNRPIPLSFQDRSWLVGVPCSPPCWYGLVPGQSSESDVISVLGDLDFIDVDSMDIVRTQFFEETVQEVYIQVEMKMKMEGRGNINFLIQEDSLKVIAESLNYEISLQEVVDAIGEPDYISPIEQPQMRGKPYCDVAIFWIEKQLSVGYQYSEKDTWLEHCEAILEGRLMNPDQIIEYFSLIDTSSGYYLYPRPEDTVPWPGFLKASD